MSPQVLFVTPNWQTPSELFLYRQREMLYTRGILRGIVVTSAEPPVKQWQTIPVMTPLLDSRVVNHPAYRVLYRVSKKLGYALPDNTDRMRGILNRLHPTAILCHYATTAIEYQEVFTSYSGRLLIHVHGYDVQHGIERPNYLSTFLNIARKAVIICNSHWMADHVRSLGVSDEHLRVKYLGVEIPPQAKQHTESEEVTILSLGRLVDFKSPDRVIEAFNAACDRGMKGTLWLAGDGPLLPMCELLRIRSPYRDRIHLLGAVTKEEGEALRSKADIFLYHGVQGEIYHQIEAFGVSIVEAMAAGLPVVATSIGGVKETVVDGVTGFLTPPMDIQAQADVLVKLAHDHTLRNRMGEAGRKRAVEVFSFEKEQQHLLDILGEN